MILRKRLKGRLVLFSQETSKMDRPTSRSAVGLYGTNDDDDRCSSTLPSPEEPNPLVSLR